MQLELKTLSQLIAVTGRFPTGMLYLANDYPWSVDTLGLIYGGNNDLEAVFPQLLKSHNLKKIFEASILEDVILNARFQKSKVSHVELVEAFNHYYKHDGFMQIT